ncbi:ABC transporter permease [Rhizobium pusense]|uniref:ABC transporter permease n=2 Tax=Agrobacterium pusense TaxID=648995 RepID=UPI00244B3534|nr:ABC transporter permease [Agrobacterium pusense]MDH1099091.1 ABC transporter permease [Agrobacterium pusense]MDH1115660.1 ABC transporter permease [Agrobacterium pusense]MDH2197435.1 ABC transporter permease [Agrobacterium pusense]
MSSSGFATRLAALTRKETRQMLRDRSNLIVGLLLPVVLILLFGYGLSFDVKNARVTVVLEDSSPTARDAVAGLRGSPYLAPTWAMSMTEAEQMVRAGQTDAILRVPSDFSRRLVSGDAQLQLLLNGVDSSTASSIEGYVSGAIAVPTQQQADRAGNKPAGVGTVTIVQRMWFNEAGESTWFLVPGLIVLVMTLIGAFLTSLLVAREWERGTLESLFVTPVRPLELVLAKLAPYIVIGGIDLIMCLLAAKYLFQVPMRGSLWIIILSSLLYLMVSLSLGLFISATTRNQFAASQMALLASFMPAMMLSGFVFDLRNVPVVIQVISQLLPATHFMGLIKTLFMAGDYWPDILRDCAILALYAVVLIALTRRALKKNLD